MSLFYSPKARTQGRFYYLEFGWRFTVFVIHNETIRCIIVGSSLQY